MAEQREILLEQMLKVLKDIETNTCDKQFFPDTNLLEKKLDHIIELHEKQIDLLKALASDRCTCKKNKSKKTGREKKSGKEKKSRKSKA
jgi:hypothetical protein